MLFKRFIFYSIHNVKSRKFVSSFNLDIEMKKFNDKNQFNKSLSLFEEYENKSNKIPSLKSLTQALKACQKLEDFQRGLQIIKEYSSISTSNDHYLLTTIIHFLSKFSLN